MDFGRPSVEPPFETLEFKFKSKLKNFPMSDVTGRLSQNMGFRVPVHILVVLGKTYAQIFFQMFLYGSMWFLMGYLKMNSDLWSHCTLVHFGSKYLKKSPIRKVEFSSVKFWCSSEWLTKLFLINSFVENLFPYRLRQTASQTDEPALRKVKNTGTIEF